MSPPPALVTGEAVVLELRPASFATRALSWLLDATVTWAVAAGAAWLLLGRRLGLDASASKALIVVWIVLVLLAAPITIETLTRGRSLGKLAGGLRVVRDDGGPIRARQAFVRALLAIPEIYATGGSVALICSLSNANGKRIGDLLAGTYVVRERSARRPPPPLPMPPELAIWAAGADIGRIPDTLALAARQLLGRAQGLHPSSRARLGAELAEQVAAYVAPPPPMSVHPERYLAAVLAERRNRDLVRLRLRQRQLGDRARRREATDVLSPTSARLVGESPRRWAGQ